METELFRILSLCGFAALSLVCGLLAWPQLSAAWPGIEEQIDRFRRLPPLAKLVLMLFVGVFVVYGSTKTNQVDQVKDEGEGEQRNLLTCSAGRPEQESNILCSPSPLTFTSSVPTVTPEDIARGWQLWEVRTNCNISYTMPEDATLATNWWVRGAYEDVNPFDFGSWRFPFGSNSYKSAWAFSWGKVRFALADTNAEIVAVGAPMSAVPFRSRLWSAADTNGSWLVTWEDFALNRDTNTPVNAQIELRTTGDFVTRSNEVETAYRRVDPEDWDGDGWRNDDDYNPYVWEEFYDYFEQELPEGANEAAYCWIEIRPRWNSEICFYGDGPSDLDDPYVYGKAGETYRVKLLIGKTYCVESSQPFDIVAKSDDRIAVTACGTDQVEIVWPVAFTVAEGRAPEPRPRLGATWNDGGKSFYVMPDPPWLGGAVTWADNACCEVWGDGTNFTYACDNTCTCQGCTVYGNYWYEGYRLPVWGLECGCHYVPDHGPAGVSISFDRSAVIYEDAYTNQPGEVVHPARSNVVLRCSAYGGTYGGTVSVTLNDAARQKLRKIRGDNLPNNVRVAPDGRRSFEVEYSVLEPSDSVDDIQAAAVFHEDFLDAVHSSDTSMTSVKVELEAVYEAPENPNPSRHVYGVGEKVNFKVTPQSSEIMLSTDKLDTGDQRDYYELFEGSVECDASSIREYVCPISANYHPPIRIVLDDVEYRPSILLVEPQMVVTPEATCTDTFLPFQVGSGRLKTTNYIGPMTVSFQGVRFVEVPCTNEVPATGYFASTNYMSNHVHDENAQAGWIHDIAAGNYWTVDEAGRSGVYPNWSAGMMEWKIPVGWVRKRVLDGDFLIAHHADYERDGDESSRRLLIGNREDKYKQVFLIYSDGGCAMEKYGYRLYRDRMWIVGVVAQILDVL